jgi:hypothetical protein
MWPPTEAVLRHHEQQQRHTHHERATANRQDEEQEILHRARFLWRRRENLHFVPAFKSTKSGGLTSLRADG